MAFVVLWLVPHAAATSFRDVPPSHTNYDAILYLQSHGVVAGYPDGTYRPDRLVSRAEFVTILVRAYLSPEIIDACLQEYGRAYTFSDVPRGAWYQRYLCAAHRINDLIRGYPDGTFRPSAPINFAEAAKILANAAALDRKPDSAYVEGSYVWYRPFVLALDRHAAIPATISSPAQPVNRGEMAEMLYRIRTGDTTRLSRTYEEIAGNAKGESPVAITSDTYLLRYHLETDPDASDPWDAAIIGRDQLTGAEVVVVESIKRQLPELQDAPNHTLRRFAQGTAHWIFQAVYMDTDRGGGPLYSFDYFRRTLAKMRVNDLARDCPAALTAQGLSPDQSALAYVPDRDRRGDEKVLYHIDLKNDRSQELVRLQEGETFDAADSACGFDSQATDIIWLDDHTLRYAVFNQLRKPARDPGEKDIFLGYRKAVISR